MNYSSCMFLQTAKGSFRCCWLVPLHSNWFMTQQGHASFGRKTTSCPDMFTTRRTRMFSSDEIETRLTITTWLPLLLTLSSCLISFSDPSGHQQSVQLPEGGPAAASGSGGQKAGPLPGVRGCGSGPAGLCVRAGGPLAGLHLVNTY